MRYKNEILSLLSKKRHARVEEIFSALKKDAPFLSIATIYRNLKALEKRAQVSGFLHPDGSVRYELSSQEHHQHLVCEGCGVIIEIRLGFVEELSQSLKERASFHLAAHRLSMVGRCKTCR